MASTRLFGYALLLVIVLGMGGLWILKPAPEGPAIESQWFAALPPGDEPRSLEAEGLVLRKAKIDDQTRNVFLPPNDQPLRVTLANPSAAVLELAIGLICPGGEECAGARKFQVRAITAGGEKKRVVFSRSLAGPSLEWKTATVDLRELESPVRELEFSVSVLSKDDEAGDGLPPVVPVWGEPIEISRESRNPFQNMILISIDTLRADHLGSYGYPLDTSPNLDAFAEDSARFEVVISHSPWTTPSHMSLMTSRYPSSHGVNRGFHEVDAFLTDGSPGFRGLASGAVTLASLLGKAGFRTLAMTGGGPIDASLGFARGFDVYRENAMVLTSDLVKDLDEAIDSLDPSVPFFLFLHTFEVHSPYTQFDFAWPRFEERERGRLLDFIRWSDPEKLNKELKKYLEAAGLFRPEVTTALYDGDIRSIDGFLGAFFEKLKQAGLFDSTVVVFTSDHGEEFADHFAHRFYDAHCKTVYDELIRVPLIMRAPGMTSAGSVITEQVELVDVAPTILDILDLPVPEDMQGRSLVPALEGGSVGEGRPALSEATCRGPEWKSLRTADWKYVAAFDVVDGEHSGALGPMLWEKLFDLRSDPREKRDVAVAYQEKTLELRTTLLALVNALAEQGGRVDDQERVDPDPELIERLRALGYID